MARWYGYFGTARLEVEADDEQMARALMLGVLTDAARKRHLMPPTDDEIVVRRADAAETRCA